MLFREPTSIEASQDTAGIIRGLLSSFQSLVKFVGKKKYQKNIVVVTNSKTVPELSEDFHAGVRQIIADQQIKLKVIGVDFDTSTQDRQSLQNMTAWYTLLAGLPGCSICNGEEVLKDICSSPPKPVRPVKVFKGDLRIGADLSDPDFDITNDISCIKIGVEGYPGVKTSRPLGRKTYGVGEYGPEKVTYVTEYMIRHYFDTDGNFDHIDPNREELDEREYEVEIVDKTSLIKAYKYGTSTVVLPEELERERLYTTSPGLDIVKVIPEDHLPRSYLSDETVLVFGQQNITSNMKALASIVDALHELKAVAIARYVKKQNSEVQMVALLPIYITKKHTRKRKFDDEDHNSTRALAMSRLPFMEDEKMAVFPDLTKQVTSSGKAIKSNHKLLPSAEAQEQMDALVRALDIDQLGIDETDFLGDKRVFNPLTNPVSLSNQDALIKRSVGSRRVDLALKEIITSAVRSNTKLQDFCKGDDVIPPIHKSIALDMEPNPRLAESASPILERLVTLLNVSKVDKTTYTRRRKALDEILQEEEEDGLSLDELLSRGVRK